MRPVFFPYFSSFFFRSSTIDSTRLGLPIGCKAPRRMACRRDVTLIFLLEQLTRGPLHVPLGRSAGVTNSTIVRVSHREIAGRVALNFPTDDRYRCTPNHIHWNCSVLQRNLGGDIRSHPKTIGLDTLDAQYMSNNPGMLHGPFTSRIGQAGRR